MITVGMNYNVITGKEIIFENAFKGVLEVMKSVKGHTKSYLFNEVDNSQHYIIISEWSDRESFDDFIGSDKFRKVADWGKEQILSSRPKHTIYER